MPLNAGAFLAIWHDIEPDSQEEYMEWHTREHMPERVSIPGFRAGKRLINHGLSRYRYGTIYTGDDVEVFRSPACRGESQEVTGQRISIAFFQPSPLL